MNTHTQTRFDFVRSHSRRDESPTLRAGDVQSLTRAAIAVLALLLDHQPHSYQDLVNWVGLQSADRRLRDLRVLGFDIKAVRVGDCRTFHYILSQFKADELPADGLRALAQARAYRNHRNG